MWVRDRIEFPLRIAKPIRFTTSLIGVICQSPKKRLKAVRKRARRKAGYQIQKNDKEAK